MAALTHYSKPLLGLLETGWPGTVSARPSPVSWKPLLPNVF